MGLVGTFGAIYEGHKPYCFISYSHTDTDEISSLLRGLIQKGCRIWYDDGIPPGDEWPETIAVHLEQASVCILFLSEEAMKSRYVFREMRFACAHNIKIICVQMGDMDLDRAVNFIGKHPEGVIAGYRRKNAGRAEAELTSCLPAEVFEDRKTSGKRGKKLYGILAGAAAMAAVIAVILFGVFSPKPETIIPPEYAEFLQELFESGSDAEFFLQDLDHNGYDELLIGTEQEGLFCLQGIAAMQNGNELKWNPLEGALTEEGGLLQTTSFQTEDWWADAALAEIYEGEALVSSIYHINDGILEKTDSFCKWGQEYFMGIELDEESFRAGQSGFENHKCLKYEYNKMLEKYTLLGDVTVFPVTQNNIEQVRRQKKNKLEGGTAIVQSRQELQINVEMLTQ